MSKFQTMAIDKIASNPYRNYSIYPIDKGQVNALVNSFDEVGDFGIIPVRPAMYETEHGETHEQACGHHRLAAMRQCGMTTCTVQIEAYSDDDMVLVMANENMRQKGDNAPAMLDSLAGIAQRVAYMMLISDTASELAEISASFNEGISESQFKKAKTSLISGNGVSRNMIELYAPEVFAKGQLQKLMTILNDSGEFANILQRVTDEVEAETKAEADAERERQEAADRATAARAKQEAVAKVAAEKARKAADKATVARKREAEANAKAQADKQAKLAKLRERAATEEAAKRATAAATQKKRDAQAKAARKSREAFEKKARGLNPEVLHMLTREDHLETFRRMVVANPNDFPVEDHPELVELIKQTANDMNKGKISRVIIQGVLDDELNKRNAARRLIAEQRKTLEEKASVVRRVDNAIAEFRRSLAKVNDAGRKLDKAMDDNDLGSYAYRELIADTQLNKEILAGYNLFDALRRKLRRRTMATTVEQ